MLAELGVTGSLVAHSERRQLFAETDESAARRIDGLLEAGLSVIACVGETEAERDEGLTEQVLERQVAAIAAVVPEGERGRLVVAYEPVWAIGTGRSATPHQAQSAHAFIHGLMNVPVLYGGSVSATNAASLLDLGDVDGALVGGASLDVESFGQICETAARIPS
jgi:triosephosphate isomerase